MLAEASGAKEAILYPVRHSRDKTGPGIINLLARASLSGSRQAGRQALRDTG